MDEADSELARVARRMDVHRLAVEEDLSRRRLVDAGEDPHQRRLAGAVLADERIHLPPGTR